MTGTFDLQNLEKLLIDFYTAVGVRISIFDDEFDLVTEYPKQAPAFCKLIRQSAEGVAACKACDMQACNRAKKLRKPHIYTCHAGICEAITPIQVGGIILGYAILAHMLSEENYAQEVDAACKIAEEKFGVPQAEGRRAIGEVTKKSAKQINAAVSILDAVSSYVYIQNLARWKNDDISNRIDEYIKNNLSEPISAENLCERFGCSRASLYQISIKAFGMGIMQYVTYCRIELAKKQLKQGKSVAEVANLCGYTEYNYFCKVFKRQTGYSPKAYVKEKI